MRGIWLALTLAACSGGDDTGKTGGGGGGGDEVTCPGTIQLEYEERWFNDPPPLQAGSSLLGLSRGVHWVDGCDDGLTEYDVDDCEDRAMLRRSTRAPDIVSDVSGRNGWLWRYWVPEDVDISCLDAFVVRSEPVTLEQLQYNVPLDTIFPGGASDYWMMEQAGADAESYAKTSDAEADLDIGIDSVTWRAAPDYSEGTAFVFTALYEAAR
jgi:hypothetical protein